MLAAISTIEGTKKNNDKSSTNDEAKLHTIYELLRTNPEVIRWTVNFNEDDPSSRTKSSSQLVTAATSTTTESITSQLEEKPLHTLPESNLPSKPTQCEENCQMDAREKT
uniref:Uncharacterized protein n=2 Tax=Eucampia antarctica TaxID=49252 RepID=A0A7S2WGF1_9STRA|mmetsp:Transcript_29844/g.28721  ORF Transcript_29844/g.28721 Transcript_29844/m.28721 type:complete len:110 (+) Transcript_29844:380-709(+)